MDHLTTDEVALFARGELADARVDHAAGCDVCGDRVAAITSAVTAALGAIPPPAMPPEVSARLTAVVEAEGRRRTSGEAARETAAQEAAHAKRLALGSFGDNSPHRNVLHKPEVAAADRQLPADARRG